MGLVIRRLLPGLLLIAAAAVVLLASDARRRTRTGTAAEPRASGAPWRLRLIHYAETTFSEDSTEGVLDGLARAGLTAGKDYKLTVSSAQGDMPTLLSLLDAAKSEDLDLLFVTTTPGLQAACKRITRLPVVFGNVADPVLAGAGRSFTDHLPNFTGVSTLSDYEAMARVVRECLPGIRRVGTLVAPAELNSIVTQEHLRKEFERSGIELTTVGVASSADVADAAAALATSGIEAICQLNASTIDTSFSAIAQAARREKRPLFAFTSGLVAKHGAAVAVARDYHQAGRDMVELALRIRRGESPAGIPFQLVSKTELVVSPKNAALCGLELPASVLARADRILED